MLLGAAVVTTALRLEINETVQAFVRETIPIRGVQNVLDDVEAGKPQTILVLGSDKRFNEKAGPGAARSDTMMLIRLDPKKGATAVMSIPRDLKATIPVTASTRSTRRTRSAGRSSRSRPSAACCTSRSTTS